MISRRDSCHLATVKEQEALVLTCQQVYKSFGNRIVDRTRTVFSINKELDPEPINLLEFHRSLLPLKQVVGYFNFSSKMPEWPFGSSTIQACSAGRTFQNHCCYT